ncbi:L-fuconolactonase [Monaibacterium marinum]|uniref:L-fuconolactonase n=1 Tax=Pontivivens marinum TaxID=1690039 RepID=A0A2C9CUK5_9RHOB|nr:amidohydrolase family protein [Monaibacterium marinum]SOH94937.1 L-fuconolactonase [Monaibacterium marinum]
MTHPVQIDAHQHFWQIARGDYDWMDDSVDPIRHDILPADLAPMLAHHHVSGTVLVQAAATVAETEFMLGLAEENGFIMGVVGWVDLTDPDAPATLDRLAQSPWFKGVRPMLQDTEATDWILQPQVMENLHALAARGLRLDALIQPRHLDVIAQVAAQVPELPIVVDHCAKPVIADGADAGDAWRAGMARLAGLPNLWCKVSGLANEAGSNWSAAGLQGVVDHVVGAFGAERVMWGSDWPVLDLVGSYAEWRAVSEALFAELTAAQREAIYGQTAIGFYGLEVAQ